MKTLAVVVLAATITLAGLAALPTAEAGARCIPTSGGMDYHSYLCVDTSDPKCPVYTITTSDWGTQKNCVPPQ